jgi:hypothetical protein
MYSGFNMSVPKGGRGKKAPYETQQMRVPVPIKNDVNKLIAGYRGLTSQQQVISVSDLESLKNEIQNLNTALINAKQEIEKLNTGFLRETNKSINLNIDLEKEAINLNTSNSEMPYEVGQTIGEGKVSKNFNLGRRVLRTPREKGETKVTFNSNNKVITLEYIGQPDGEGKSHIWKVIEIDEPQKTPSLF